MAKKKIVSIEDRIPKLKQARKKKANRRLVFYLSIFFILISVIIYIQSPLSDVKTVKVTGNHYVTDEKVTELAGLDDFPNIWTISKKDMKKDLKAYPLIQSVEIDKKLPQTVQVNVEEYDLVGYVKQDEYYLPVLENGEKISEIKSKTMQGNAPLILDFTEGAYLEKMSEELNKLPRSIRNLISEIHWTPKGENKNKILLYMNDGFMVDGTIRNFSEKMKVYPSIVSQLPEDEKGIIHIGVGAYFESFTSEE